MGRLIDPENKMRALDLNVRDAVKRLTRRSILIVDDDPIFTSEVKAWASEHDEFRVVVTANVFQFFKAVGRNSLAAVVIDWSAPKFGGEIVLGELVEEKFTKMVMSKSPRESLNLTDDVIFIDKNVGGYYAMEKIVSEIYLQCGRKTA